MNDAEPDAPTAIPQQQPEDVDLSEEIQDYRFLTIFTKSSAAHPSIPKRGEKDFAPDGTDYQTKVLAESRQALYDALAATKEGFPENRSIWIHSKQKAQLGRQCGSMFKSMGRTDNTGITWLEAEEVIYLAERGALECYYAGDEYPGEPSIPNPSTDIVEFYNATHSSKAVPLDLTGVYALCLPACNGIENYNVYAYLRRNGYMVRRASTFWGPPPPSPIPSTPISLDVLLSVGLGPFKFLYQIFHRDPRTTNGPLIKPGRYKNYTQIYRALQLFDTTTTPKRLDPELAAPFSVTFDVHKPTPMFAKMHAGPPDFRIVVVNAHTQVTIPTLTQLESLFSVLPSLAEIEVARKDHQRERVEARNKKKGISDAEYKASFLTPGGEIVDGIDAVVAEPRKKHIMARIKDGDKNIILAVADGGVTSFMKWGEAPFTDEMMYKEFVPGSFRGGKGGGGRGRGRGGARGGRGGRGGRN
ncbi:hypothetical protein BJ508DRAFT_410954 [Ascobolus immersus RN42]|uniref:tRNA-splicing endonuclease subunit Sen54 N-terminal domain-containing protein n=1 Tax=Ascobolus immersus RN42 TaxID=1160509 RepID=A0A3N4ILL0_ASCIM|nr:hypothetical protein BJ508DRAFT_410954 [Ascobolus immersus RN42]